MDLSDRDLIRQSLDDPEAFALIFDRHYPLIRDYLVRRVGEAGTDLAAETFAIAFDQRRTFDTARELARPWLFGIATHLVSRHRRSESRRLRASERLTGGTDEISISAIAARADAAALAPTLFRAVRELSSEERDVLLLIAWTELSYAEVADALGLPVGTVRSRLHRARARLRSRLDPHLVELESIASEV